MFLELLSACRVPGNYGALFINPFWVPTQDNYKEWLEKFSADFDFCWLIGGNYFHSPAGGGLARLAVAGWEWEYSLGRKLVVYVEEELFVNRDNKNWENLTTELIDKNRSRVWLVRGGRRGQGRCPLWGRRRVSGRRDWGGPGLQGGRGERGGGRPDGLAGHFL